MLQAESGQASCRLCSQCGPGKYISEECSTTTDRQCEECPAGTTSIGGGVFSCTPCNTLSSFQPDTGQASCRQCSQCGPGKYITEECSTTADRQCEECPTGHASIGGKAECDECEAGTPADVGSSVCTPCPQYEEQDVALGYDLNSCVCKGTFVRDPTTDKCSCEPGFTLTGETCSPCEIGRFKDDYGVHSCSRCEVREEETHTGGRPTDKSKQYNSTHHQQPPFRMFSRAR